MSYSYSSCECYECLRMDLKDRYKYDGNMAYCTGFSRYIDIHDKACSKYFVYNEEMKDSTGCYLTTAMCKILGFKDDCFILNSLRNFRETKLKPNKKMHPILFEYDIIGPIITARLNNDDRKKQVAACLLKNYIKPIILFIEQNEDEKATSLYKQMTNNLKILYGIDKKLDLNTCKCNMKTLGKART